ncbi:MAG TPA: replication-relaxation family protein [Candidatus Saccharimonadales bacterium]|nr:replication-relaxation family protein [Candidatus Saccharimonadales bacterium]
MTKPLPLITPKQQAILKLIYKYRFPNRIQIQTLLKHKDKRRIISWLKDLRDKQYVDWHYNPNDFIAKSQPAIYYLSLNGIRYLRSLNEYPSQELRKRYKEPARTKAFIDHCLLIADCCIALQAKSNDELKYVCVLPADYIDPDSEYHFLDGINPHLFFAKQQSSKTTNYLLENFEQTLPRYQLRKRVKDCIEYLADWDEANGTAPIALFICPNVADLLYVKRRIKKLIEEDWPNEELHFRVTTLDKVQASGVASMIWEEV